MTDLYPAIDLLGGRVVRLRQGDYADETVYGDDPVAAARRFAAAGAPWVHVVDLDAARSGDPINRPVVAAIASAVRGQAHVQTGGGVRSLADARELADAGVARVVMGSAAVSDPSLVDAASRIVPVAVGLDHHTEGVEAARMGDRMGLDRHDGAGASGVNRGADEPRRAAQGLTPEDPLANLHNRLGTGSRVLVQRVDETRGDRHRPQRPLGRERLVRFQPESAVKAAEPEFGGGLGFVRHARRPPAVDRPVPGTGCRQALARPRSRCQC